MPKNILSTVPILVSNQTRRQQRRQVLKAGLGATALFLPVPYAWVWAQSEGAMKLLRLPKLALVIGNGKYEDSKPLKNPVNDAQAISGSLKASGFEVTTWLDIKRDEMLATVRAYTGMLAKRQCVGLFYFAGHGAQLSWRNYLLPVDAVIDGIEDIPKQCVDLEVLIRGVRDASNPMNIIILDACRDNPFGRDFRVNEKGLSQMDAPNSTLLAYATSPGNYASDGDGVNGLYTENLLRELKVPDAKIEDVFKRVRLNVRRTSKGAQIPWESTSLEEDFYFNPPKSLRKLSEQEVKQLFEAESTIWEKIKESNSAAPLEDYLRRYPSGNFSELAQAQLDRVLAGLGEKKIRIVSNAANPYSKGTGVTNTDYKVGDAYTFRIIDILTRVESARFSESVVKLTDNEVIFSNGVITDYLGNSRLDRAGSRRSSHQSNIAEYSVGKRWESRSITTNAQGLRGVSELSCHVAAREPVTVPAGTFDAFRVQIRGFVTFPGFTVQIDSKFWIAPDKLRRLVAGENLWRVGSKLINTDRSELVSFKEG